MSGWGAADGEFRSRLRGRGIDLGIAFKEGKEVFREERAARHIVGGDVAIGLHRDQEQSAGAERSASAAKPAGVNSIF